MSGVNQPSTLITYCHGAHYEPEIPVGNGLVVVTVIEKLCPRLTTKPGYSYFSVWWAELLENLLRSTSFISSVSCSIGFFGMTDFSTSI